MLLRIVAILLRRGTIALRSPRLYGMVCPLSVMCAGRVRSPVSHRIATRFRRAPRQRPPGADAGIAPSRQQRPPGTIGTDFHRGRRGHNAAHPIASIGSHDRERHACCHRDHRSPRPASGAGGLCVGYGASIFSTFPAIGPASPPLSSPSHPRAVGRPSLGRHQGRAPTDGPSESTA